jgi:hypothetical protein
MYVCIYVTGAQPSFMDQDDPQLDIQDGAHLEPETMSGYQSPV